jgi:hypothetical protein
MSNSFVFLALGAGAVHGLFFVFWFVKTPSPLPGLPSAPWACSSRMGNAGGASLEELQKQQGSPWNCEGEGDPPEAVSI